MSVGREKGKPISPIMHFQYNGRTYEVERYLGTYFFQMEKYAGIYQAIFVHGGMISR
jgi:hypothetical protein